VSCNTISKDEFERTIPVNPPTVNKNTNPNDQYKEGEKLNRTP
jgi:hypothetical protein